MAWDDWRVNLGLIRLKASRTATESGKLTTGGISFASGSPPKSMAWDVLTALIVCQATEGPWTEVTFKGPFTSSQGGVAALNELERSRYRTSALSGADV